MIKEMTDLSIKEDIASSVLHDLPEWFGLPESTNEYIQKSKEMPFFAKFVDQKPVGFGVLRETSPYAVELYCMGVLKEHHRLGYGKEIVDALVSYAKEKKYKFIQVKTVELGKYDIYDKTNQFYRSLGFYELEVFSTLWDESNPCQVYVQSL